MTSLLLNHLWQSTLFVVAAWLVTLALRKNGAHVRHRIWVIASLKFLVPFSLLMSLGAWLPLPATTAAITDAAEPPALSIAVGQIAQPFAGDLLNPPTPEAPRAVNWTTVGLGGAWACGVLVLVAVRVRGWLRIRAAVRASTPFATEALSRVRSADRSSVRGAADLEPGPPYVRITVRSTRGLLEPGVVGLWRPVLLLPAGIELRLTPPQLDAVLAHELCHMRRRDNLTSAIHMVVEAVFWFHPLVWFVGARLIDERERACDEHVLRVCGQPQTYAESILNVCKLYVESPIACVSGIGGSNLRERVAAILVNRVGRQLSLTRKVTLAIMAVLAIVLPLIAGMLVAPLGARAEAAASAVQPAAAGTQSGKAELKFDVVSVKPCGPDSPPQPSRAGGAGQASVGYLNLSCLTLKQFVNMSYAGADSPLLNRHGGEDYVPDAPKSVRGGPSWAYSETYTIEAKADGVTDRDILTGPMLRAVLDDRFQLKTHRATEQQSMYTLTVAKGGLKIKPLAQGDCWEFEPGKPTPPHAQNVGPCGSFGGDGWGSEQANGVWLGDSARVREGFRMVDLLWRAMLRVVIDKTGLNGRYSFAFDFTPDDTTPGVQGPGRAGLTERPTTFKSGDTIFQALEKLGLHLAQTKAPSEYLVIDSAERPKPDDPADDVVAPARAKAASAKASAGQGSPR